MPLTVDRTEEREVVVGEPAKKRGGLGIGTDQRVSDRRGLLPHRRPVTYRHRHVGEHGAQIGGEHLYGAGGGPVELDKNPRLEKAGACEVFRHRREHAVAIADDTQQRVQQQMDREAVARERHRDRVDQKRHVVGDDSRDGGPVFR